MVEQGFFTQNLFQNFNKKNNKEKLQKKKQAAIKQKRLILMPQSLKNYSHGK